MKQKDLDDAQATLDKYPYVNTATWDAIDALGAGNCKNYVVGKLHYLLDRGWPIESLRIGICDVEPQYRQPNVNHAVLVVAFEGREYILDQRKTFVVTIDELAHEGYTPIQIQEHGGSPNWCAWKWARNKE